MGLHQFWMVKIVVVVQLLSISSNSQHLTCHPSDQEALRDSIKKLDPEQDVWGTNSSKNCCEWVGITCNSSSSLGLNDPNNTARVTKLEMVNTGSWNSPGRLSESLGRLHQIRVLNFSNNGIYDSIPQSIYNLVNLEILDLSSNHLNGSLSPAIANLSSLVHLDVSRNQFSGDIPDVFNKLSELKILLANDNNFTGGLPKSLAHSQALVLLRLGNNLLTGPLHLNCDVMTNLTTLDLQSNQLDSSLPENLPSCRNLRNVNLAENLFDGQVPQSFRDFHSLLSLSLTTVKISAALDTLQQCKNLTALVLANSFYGEILRDQPGLHFKKLKVLTIHNCWLTGPLPSWLSKSTNLQVLDLSGNRFTGAIPEWIGGFSNLFYLNLSGNWFTGEIPKSLTTLQSLSSRVNESSPEFAELEFLPTLDLSQNNLYGPIWKEFGNLKRLHVFNLGVNRVSGSIPRQLSEMTRLEVLDLSQNNLSGHIWKEFGNLKELRLFYMNDNGGISGSIPRSMEKLTSLYNFNVANNNLSGTVPSGGRFLTFSSENFQGNHLCGYGWTQCPVDTSDDDIFSDSSYKDDFVLDFTYGLALGYGLALIIVASLTSSYFQFPGK